MLMKIIIRADLNNEIATGHVMRCLSLADGARNRGHEVSFICASEDPRELIEGRGYEITVLNSDFKKMEDEQEKLLPVLAKEQPDMFVMDSYFVTDRYVESISKVCKTAYIDDFANHAFPVDILINYNAYGESTPYEDMYKKANVKLPILIRGTKFAPLRREFLKLPPHIESEKFEVLLSTGGADLTHVSAAAVTEYLKLAAQKPYSEMRLNVLLGRFNEDREEIVNLAETDKDHIRLWENVTDMPAFLSNFDMALSAAGSTTYELCCMGIPTVLFYTADNQEKIHNAFKENGLLRTAGFTKTDKDGVIKRLLSSVKEMYENPEILKEYGKKASMVTDGHGAERIVEEIENVERV